MKGEPVMKMKRCLALTACVFLLPFAALAQEKDAPPAEEKAAYPVLEKTVPPATGKPTSEEAKRFLDFYYHGRGKGTVLMEMKVCKEIEPEGDNKNECVDEVSASSLVKEKSYYFWMSYLTPENDEINDIAVQFNQGGETKSAKELSVSGSIRYRTWKMFTPRSAGDWEIKVVRGKGDKAETLGSLNVKVSEE